MRDISVVAEQMKKYIENNDDVIEIDKILKSAIFTSPESMYLKWNQLHEVMTTCLPDNNKDFTEDHWILVSIFTGRTIEELKKMESK